MYTIQPEVPGFCPSMGLVAVHETESGSCDLSVELQMLRDTNTLDMEHLQDKEM